MVAETTPKDPGSLLPLSRIVAVALICTTIAFLVCYSLDMFQANKIESELRNLPPLIPAPSLAVQSKMIVDMGRHPNPPFVLGDLIPHGTDAAGLAPLLGVMGSPTKDGGALIYRKYLSPDLDNQVATLCVEIAGNPPRVLYRRLESGPNN